LVTVVVAVAQLGMEETGQPILEQALTAHQVAVAVARGETVVVALELAEQAATGF
jgi:hypothetical protein